MTRILVFSDSHGNMENMEKIIENLINVDYIIHLGDHANDARKLEDYYPDQNIIYVSGNCDFCDPQPAEKSLEIDGFKFFITHGHPYGVKISLAHLKMQAVKNGYDCILFGHTHVPLCEKFEKTLLLNPGSARESYGIIEIENGEIKGCTMNVY